MKFQPDSTDGVSITAYTDEWIAVNGVAHHNHLLIDAQGRVEAWQHTQLEQWPEPDCQRILQSHCELLLLGTGRRHLPIAPARLTWFFQRGIGVEAMATAAACRTFNVLAGEGRKVVGIFLLPRN